MYHLGLPWCAAVHGVTESDTSEHLNWTELVAQMVENLPAMKETWVQPVGLEDSLEKGKVTDHLVHYLNSEYVVSLAPIPVHES